MTLVIVAQVVFLVTAAAYLVDTWRHRHELLDLPVGRSRPAGDAELRPELLVRWDDGSVGGRCERVPHRAAAGTTRSRRSADRRPAGNTLR